MAGNPTRIVIEDSPLVRFVDAHLDASMDRRDKGLAPVWESANEQARTLVTLSSGALVLSISVMQFLGPRLAGARDGWCVPTAWLCFAATVVMAATRHGWAARARAFRANLEDKRADIRGRVRALPDSPDFITNVDAVLEEVLKVSNEDANGAFAVVARIQQWMWGSFTLGLILLLAFALRNLPF